MVRTVIIASLVALLLPGLAIADVVVMQDGRTFSGSVTIEGNIVIVRMSYGSLSLPRAKVARIELKDTPEEKFENRLAEIDSHDENALAELGTWAIAQGLKRRGEQLLGRVLTINPDNAAARRALGYARIDAQWREFDKAVQLVRSKLEAGNYDVLLKKVLPAIDVIAVSPRQKITVGDLRGQTQLRGARFADAAKTYATLAMQTKGLESIRLKAVADIVKASPDGMYVLTQAYPPTAGLLGRQAQVPAGPASLTRPIVLEAALKDLAKDRLETGRKLVAEGRTLEIEKPEQAKAKYLRALTVFDVADALIPDITRSHRIQIARQRITMIRRGADADARRFDAALANLGRKDMSKQAYREMVTQMLRDVNAVRGALQDVLAVAKPYPHELIMEVQFAETDLKKIESMREVLVGELDAS